MAPFAKILIANRGEIARRLHNSFSKPVTIFALKQLKGV
jgi:acetyl/propionyl-CoA carboxylase alpha subunit